MDFNPDQYLSEDSFDPNAYLGEQAPPQPEPPQQMAMQPNVPSPLGFPGPELQPKQVPFDPNNFLKGTHLISAEEDLLQRKYPDPNKGSRSSIPGSSTIDKFAIGATDAIANTVAQAGAYVAGVGAFAGAHILDQLDRSGLTVPDSWRAGIQKAKSLEEATKMTSEAFAIEARNETGQMMNNHIAEAMNSLGNPMMGHAAPHITPTAIELRNSIRRDTFKSTKEKPAPNVSAMVDDATSKTLETKILADKQKILEDNINNIRATQEIYNRQEQPPVENPTRPRGLDEPVQEYMTRQDDVASKVDQSKQEVLPLENSLNDMAESQNIRQKDKAFDSTPPDYGRQMDMFVEDTRRDPAAAALRETQSQLDALIEQRRKLEQDITQKSMQDHIDSAMRVDQARKKVEVDAMWNRKETDAAQVKREQVQEAKDAALQPLEERLRKNAYKPTGDGQGPKTRAFKSNQRGAINMDMFSHEKDFFKLKIIRSKDGTPYVMTVKTKDGAPHIAIYAKNNEQVLDAGFIPTKIFASADANAFVSMIETDFDHRGKGLAKAAYEFMSELGNDIQASSVQLFGGRAMWDSFERSGFSKNRVISKRNATPQPIAGMPITRTFNARVPQSQRGAIDFDALGKGLSRLWNPAKVMDLPDMTYRTADAADIPSYPKPETVVNDYLVKARDGEIGKEWNWFGSGGHLQATITNSPLIKGVTNYVQIWGKHNERFVREVITPLEKKITSLSGKEQLQVKEAIMAEAKAGVAFTPESMAKNGFTKSQIEAHVAFRMADEAALRLQNEARAARGQDPINREEFHYAARWVGKFGSNIINAEGKIVWKLTAPNRFDLQKQIDILLKKFPDLKYEDSLRKIHGKAVVIPKDFDRFSARGLDHNSLQTAYTMMVDVLGREDAQVKAIKAYMETEFDTSGRNVGKQELHFKEKIGMRGFAGDRADIMDPVKDAREFFHQNTIYLKNASRWSEIQKAIPALKEILTNPDVVAQNPAHLKYVQDYVANAMGYGEAQGIKHVEDSISKYLGESKNAQRLHIPTELAPLLGTTKHMWISSKLMFSAGYALASNAFQLMNTASGHVRLYTEGFGSNPITPIVMGAANGMALASLHYISLLRNEPFQKALDKFPLPEYLKKAYEYAENNSVTNRSINDETPVRIEGVTASRIKDSLPVKLTRGSIDFSVAGPETYARSIAYASFVDHLHNSGKFNKATWNQMFALAEEMVNNTMGDARQSERAPIFNKTGTIGSAFNTLQTYPMNWLNQVGAGIAEAKRGNPYPIVTMLGVQVALAGILGLPIINDIADFWEVLKNKISWPAPVYDKIKNIHVKSMAIEFNSKFAYGVPSEALGLGLTSRLNAPSLSSMATIPGGMIFDIGRTMGDIGEAVAAIDNPTKWAQAALTAAPPGLKEITAQTILEKYGQTTHANGNIGIFPRSQIADRTAKFERTPEQHAKARWGIRLQSEVKKGDIMHEFDATDKGIQAQRSALIKDIYNSMRLNGKPDQDSIDYFYKFGGKGLKGNIKEKIIKEYTTALQREAISAPGKNMAALIEYKRMLDLLKGAGLDPTK
jgi:hypothetical protein